MLVVDLAEDVVIAGIDDRESPIVIADWVKDRVFRFFPVDKVSFSCIWKKDTSYTYSFTYK